MRAVEIATSDLFDLYAFPVSRQLYALKQVEHALVGCNDALLCGWVTDALRLGEQAYELQLEFSRRRHTTQFGAQARIVDRELDRALGAVAKFMAAVVQAYGEPSKQAELARFAAGRLFPNGVAAVIHLPYVEEEIAVRMLLRRAKTEPQLRQALRELGATPFLERVAALHVRYQEALRDARPRPSFTQVKQARQAGQERLCQILALLVVRLATAGHEADQAAALRKALGELIAQNAAIGRLHKRRRGVTEVDPETGEELEANSGEELNAEVGEDVVEAGEDDAELEQIGETDGESSSPLGHEDLAEVSQRVAEPVVSLGERVVEPWRPGDLDGMDVRRGLARRRHHQQPRAG